MERIIQEEEFRALVDVRCDELIALAAYMDVAGTGELCFTRPLLGTVHLEATRTEELLDAYGAKQNRRWYPLRRKVAPVKLFSNVSYILQHILQFLPTYKLLPIQADFREATENALRYTCRVLKTTVHALLDEARELGLSVPESAPMAERFAEYLPTGHLPFDRPREKVASPEETVVYLATAFLNLAEDSRFLHDIADAEVDRCADWIPDPINEARLRDLEQEFHNLQSLYDTHISDSNVESLDEHLPVLRGHISVIYHLLQTATDFAHYCERHLSGFSERGSGKQEAESHEELVEPGALLEALMGYSLAFSGRYILRTRNLCHQMLRRYAIQGRVSVPVPRYRGFHVRPSTLIAKIVNHYGSPVEMALEDETYNAGVTLDLFRANEKLNARKRRRIAEEVRRLMAADSEAARADTDGLKARVRRVVQTLFQENKLVLYERVLPLEDLSRLEGESPTEFVARALNQLLALGKIDVEVDTLVSFAGDRRVLEDIRLLAENGYGEDAFGNNLPLPEPLSYLRK
ncbi:MAG: hypothetical protein JW820_17030 [Spirochaetales bacterium]|nr:hypothetical protein [Spirochaetales bacterium]